MFATERERTGICSTIQASNRHVARTLSNGKEGRARSCEASSSHAPARAAVETRSQLNLAASSKELLSRLPLEISQIYVYRNLVNAEFFNDRVNVQKRSNTSRNFLEID